MDTQLLLKLNALIARELKTKADGSVHSGTQAPEAPVEEEKVKTRKKKKKDEEDDEDEDVLPGSERAHKKKQTGVYEAPDDEDQEIIDAMDREQREDDDEDMNAPRSEPAAQKKPLAVSTDTDCDVLERRRIALGKCPYVVDVKYTADRQAVDLVVQVPYGSKRLLMGPLAEKACRNSVLRATPGIEGSFTVEKKMVLGTKKEWLAQTDGVNLQEVFKHSDLIDVNRINLNDICAILKTYGVEAARAAIVNEITGVFGVYGIEVNKRHLTLLADYMTFNGGYKPLNRIGMSSSVSPFQKISFETSVNFLLDACLLGDPDRMVSPSARIVLGQPAHSGTGHMECVVPLKYN